VIPETTVGDGSVVPSSVSAGRTRFNGSR